MVQERVFKSVILKKSFRALLLLYYYKAFDFLDKVKPRKKMTEGTVMTH